MITVRDKFNRPVRVQESMISKGEINFEELDTTDKVLHLIEASTELRGALLSAGMMDAELRKLFSELNQTLSALHDRLDK